MKYIPPLNDTLEREGKYVTANPIAGVRGSTVPAEAIEHPMREIVNCIEQAGLTPSDADLTQLQQVLDKYLKIQDADKLGIPVGFIGIFLAETPPAGWLECNGSLVSRETYPELWAYAQSSGNILAEDTTANEGHFTVGDGLTTFRLPNPQGTFFRVLDKTRGVDPDSCRVVGSEQMDAFKSHTHLLGTTTEVLGNAVYVLRTQMGSSLLSSTSGITSTGDSETRPRNTAILCCIKAFDGATNQGLIDITALANELNNKVDKVDIKAPGDAPYFVCRAWVHFNGADNLPTIHSQGNISSVTKQVTGIYTINFLNPMVDAHYVCSVVSGGFMHSILEGATANSVSVSVKLANGADGDSVRTQIAIFR